MISTQHLLPSALPTPTMPQEAPPIAQAADAKAGCSNGAQPQEGTGMLYD